MMKDKNVQSVIKKLRKRSAEGIIEYGQPTNEALLQEDDWLEHLQEELIDAIVYIEAYFRAKKFPFGFVASPKKVGSTPGG